jgi:hypothetical protein
MAKNNVAADALSFSIDEAKQIYIKKDALSL